MSTGSTRGQQCDFIDNHEDYHESIELTTTTTLRGRRHQVQRPLQRRRRYAKTTFFYALLASYILERGVHGFTIYSGWSSSSRRINDGPVETDLRREDFRQGFVGCLHQEDLCNADEICLDDSLFGRCLVIDL